MLTRHFLRTFILLVSGLTISCKDDPKPVTPKLRWIQVADFPGPSRYGATSFTLGNFGYVGLGDKSPAGDFWKYDPVKNKWSGDVNSFAVGSAFLNQSFFVLNNEAYVGSGSVNTFRKYSAETNDWKDVAWPFPGKFDGAISSAVNGKGYVLTGLRSGNAVLQFDPSNQTWTKKKPIQGNYERYKSATFTIGDLIYLATGAGESQSVLYRDLWAYNTVTDQWGAWAPLPSNWRWQATGFAINGKGYLVGGITNEGYSNEVWMFDPAKDTWTNLGVYPGGKVAGLFAFVIGDKAYVGTGVTSVDGITRKDVWQFDPQGTF